jgi:pentatricopeptide repeat protein
MCGVLCIFGERHVLTSILYVDSEDVYGVVIHSFAVAKEPDMARSFMQSMEEGAFGEDVKPGTKCYSAAILSYVRAAAWDDAVSAYESMKNAGVSPDPASFHGLLLASFRLGGSSRVKKFVEELLESNSTVTQESCELVLKILIPALQKNETTVTTRVQLRVMGEEDPSMSTACLNLSRSLRTAELEQSRKPSKILTDKAIVQRRKEAWLNVLRHALECAEAAASRQRDNVVEL